MRTIDEAGVSRPARREPLPATVSRRDALALVLRHTPLEALASLANRGDVVELRLPLRRVYLLNHPSHVRQVLVTDAARFTRGLAIERSRVVLGDSLLTTEGDEHRRQRRLLQPAFHRQVLAAHVAGMARAAAARAKHWHHGQTIDVSKEMLGLTLRCVVETLFGEDSSAWGDDVGEALGVLFDISPRLLLPMGPALLRLPLPAHRRFARARGRLRATVARLIEQSRRRRAGLLGPLLAPAPGDATALSDAEARDHVMTLLLAGHETTACALTWTWHLLAAQPDVEARLLEETGEVLGARLPRSEDLPRLPYAERVFAEAMRLYPPVWSIGRRVRETARIDGHAIPRGSFVMLNPWVIHRDPRFWPDPERFDPDRFSPETASLRPREAYFPFGDGRRRCIGEPFAWLLGVTALATLARRVRLVPDATREVRPLTYLFLLYPGSRPRGSRDRLVRGLPMRVEPR